MAAPATLRAPIRWRLATACLALCGASAAYGQASVPSSPAAPATPATVTTESRDAVLGYVGTMNFAVGRAAAHCLPRLGRADTPQAFVAAWQRRNARFLAATDKYMSVMLAEAEAAGGAERRDAVLRQLMGMVRASAEQVVASLMRGDPATACQRVIGLMETAAFDIGETSPMFREVLSLVRWAEQDATR